jgi:aprataxin and PNK-like factor
VEYVVNPQHVRAFENKRLELAASMDWDDTKPILAFHGTAETNISSIIKKNFSIAKVGSATDAGWYGAGCYFSEDPGLSMGYTRGATKFLLCQILLGRVYKCPGMMNGAPLKVRGTLYSWMLALVGLTQPMIDKLIGWL